MGTHSCIHSHLHAHSCVYTMNMHTHEQNTHTLKYIHIYPRAHACVHSHAYTCIRNTHMHMTHVHSCAHAHPVCHLSGRIEDAASHIWMPGHNIEGHRTEISWTAELSSASCPQAAGPLSADALQETCTLNLESYCYSSGRSERRLMELELEGSFPFQAS